MSVKIREFREEHLDNTFIWMQDEKLKRDFLLGITITKESHFNWFKRYQEDPTQKIWAIYFENQHVGNVGLKNIDLKNKKAEVWIYIGVDNLKGKHIGSNTWNLLFSDVSFLNLKLHKVYSVVANWNNASNKMFLNAGFTKEGYLIDECFTFGEYITLVRYGKILK